MSLRILVVDDHQQKIAKVVDALTTAGVARDDIDVTLNGVEARKKLKQVAYDVMLLDISLPMRPEDEPDPKGGLALLSEITDRDVYKKPRHVVGVTAYEELKNELSARFAEHIWTLLYCSPTSDGWLAHLSKLASYLLGVQASTATRGYDVDLCVVTALSEPELSEVLQLPWSWGEGQLVDSCTVCYEGTFDAKGGDVRIVAASANRSGMVPTAILASKLIHRFRPRFLAMTGICAGIRAKCHIGDVILGSVAWDWQRGKHVSTDGASKHLIEPTQIAIPSYVTARFEQMQGEAAFWAEMRQRWRGQRPDEALALRIGPVASGAVVLNDEMAVKHVVEQHRQLLGIEMEAFGLYGAAFYGPDPRPTFFSIKSVSDYGDEEKDDKFQAYAAYTSAQTLGRFVEGHLVDLKDMAGRF